MGQPISTIRDSLKTRFETITGLRGLDTIPTGEIVPPVFVVVPENGRPRTLTGTRDELNFRIKLALSAESERTAQDKLDGYLQSTGSTSIRVALAAASNLGLAGVKAIWNGWENYGLVDISGYLYFGAEVLVVVDN